MTRPQWNLTEIFAADDKVWLTDAETLVMLGSVRDQSGSSGFSLVFLCGLAAGRIRAAS